MARKSILLKESKQTTTRQELPFEYQRVIQSHIGSRTNLRHSRDKFMDVLKQDRGSLW